MSPWSRVRVLEGPSAAGTADLDLPPSLRRTYWLWPALATLAITCVEANRAQPWRDELATWHAATRAAGDLLRLIGNIDGVNGPYYLLMHGWIAVFGDSVLALRLPSILAMTGAAALLAALGARLFSPRTGLLAGLLFAVLPSTSRYAQEARSYAFATLFAVLATLLLVTALDRGGWGRWAGYTAAVLGLGLAHLVAVTLLVGHAAAVLLTRRADRGRALLRWLAALAPAAVLLVPFALLGHDQRGQQLGWVSRSNITELLGLPGSVVQASTVGGMLVGLAAVGAVSRGRRGAVLALFVLIPTGLLFVGGRLTPLWVPRYLVFVVPFGCLLAAGVLAGLRLRAALPIVALLGLLGAPAQAELRHTHEWPRSAPIDYRAAMRIIDARQQPGDGIVYSPRTGWAFLDLAADYHLRPERPRDVLATRDQRQRADLWATECAAPQTCLAPVHRVWLVVKGERTDPLRDVPEPKATALRTGFTVRQVWTVPGLTVALLTR